MCLYKPTYQLSPGHQTGAVLIVSLIMLLLLTVIGTASMQSTSLEEKMAGNMRNKSLAFQNAEAALRAAELLIPTLNQDSFNNTNGLYTETGTPPGSDDNWANFSTRSHNAAAGQASSAPLYVIQRILDNGRLDLNADVSNLYRITARGVGGTDTAVVVVQSIFRN